MRGGAVTLEARKSVVLGERELKERTPELALQALI
jgi:hypothetical protein